MTKKLKLNLLGILLIMTVGFLTLYWGLYFLPLKIFRNQEVNSMPLFDNQNEAVLKELPKVPDGIKLISKGAGGIIGPTNIHGHNLELIYSIDTNSKLTPGEVIIYYQNALIKSGWEKSHIEDNTLWRDTACIKIDVIFTTKEYYIDIWQDFSSQKFSPILPPSWLLNIYDFGETDILTCPPQ